MKRHFTYSVFLILLSCSKDVDLLQAVLLSPSKVELTHPEKNSECTTGNVISEFESEVIFDWTDADVGDVYEVHLTNLITGQEKIYESDSSSLNIVLLRGTPFQWKVSTILNDSQESTDSDTEAFYNSGPGVQSFVPFPASPISPKNGEAIETGGNPTVVLQWQTNDLDEDIVSYDVFFGSDNPPSLFAQGVDSNSLSGVPVNQGETFFWKIRTRDVQNNESNSQIFSFTVN